MARNWNNLIAIRYAHRPKIGKPNSLSLWDKANQKVKPDQYQQSCYNCTCTRWVNIVILTCIM